MKQFAVGLVVLACAFAAGCGDDDDEPEVGKAACAHAGAICFDYGDTGATTLADFQKSCESDFYADKFCTDLPKGACVSFNKCANEFYWASECDGIFLEDQDCAALPTGRCLYTDSYDNSRCSDGVYEEGCKQVDGVLEIDQLCPND